jgi:hypothetical protein
MVGKTTERSGTMISKLRNVAALGLFLGSLAMTGCLGDSNPASPGNTSDDEFDNLDLTSENGGYTEENEGIPDDPTILKIKGEEEVAGDVTLVDESSLDVSPSYDVHFLRITWGMLERELGNTTETDWSGTISIDRGALKVERLISFEENEDWIVRPRESRQAVEFVSRTSMGSDGLVLKIYTPEVEPAMFPPNTITFTTGPLTKSYPIASLGEVNEVIEVDMAGNQVSFQGRQRTDGICVNGFTNGFWRMNEAGDRGRFGGVWVESDGAPVGYVRGHFGVNDQGQKVLFGKILTENGDFRGFLRGRYAVSELGGGSFEGSWVGALGRIEGKFEGMFRVNEKDGVQVGAYEGVWAGNCSADPGLGDVAGS